MRVQVILPMLIIHMKIKFTVELKWNMEMLSITCCQGDNQLLMWNFTKEENERIAAYHWFFNEKTLICLDSETIGFHVTNLYKGRVERIGTLGIRLKNVSLTDAGEYTLLVKLDPEKQRTFQGISLTVVGHHRPSQCKPIITRQSNSIISCSTQCERSSLSPEWIINGTNETVGIGPYLTVDPHLTSEHLLCCLRSLTCHNDDQFKLCTQNHISFADNIHVNSQIEISTNTATQHNGTVMMTILFILGAIVLLVLPAVVIFYWKRRHKLSRRLRDGNQNDNNVNKICLDADQVLMQNLEAAKDTSDTDSHYEDGCSVDTRVPSKLGENEGYLRVLQGLGLVIAAIMLLVTGSLLLVTLRRKIATSVSDTHPLHYSIDGQLNIEWSQRITEQIQTVPVEEDNALNCAPKQNYQKTNSLQTCAGNTQNACNPGQNRLSVQTVMHLSHTNTMLGNAKDSANKLYDSGKDHWPCNFECTSDRIGLNDSHPVIQQDRNMGDDERTTGATCICLANSGCGRFEPELQENLYTTIDEPALSVYDYAGANQHEDKIQEDNRNNDVGNFIYDYAVLPSP